MDLRRQTGAIRQEDFGAVNFCHCCRISCKSEPLGKVGIIESCQHCPSATPVHYIVVLPAPKPLTPCRRRRMLPSWLDIGHPVERFALLIDNSIVLPCCFTLSGVERHGLTRKARKLYGGTNGSSTLISGDYFGSLSSALLPDWIDQ
jgi:hypothetical protein